MEPPSLLTSAFTNVPDRKDMISRFRILLLFLILPAFASATGLSVAFAINAQVPPVARVSESYFFQFSASTFAPYSDDIQYTLTSAPPWLSLNGPNRTLWGTPGASDVGSPAFTITGASQAGGAVMPVTLVVVSPPAPVVQGNISSVLAAAGQLSGPATVALDPSSPFSIKFPADLFSSDGSDSAANFKYLSTSGDHTPLPGWISFDPTTLTFTGTTPVTATLPQRFDILLIASDIVGFASASVQFTISINRYSFLFSPREQTVQAKAGEVVTVNLRDQLLFDGYRVADTNIQSAWADVPSWLSFNAERLEITGIPPAGVMERNISIGAVDYWGDIANATVHLQIESAQATATSTTTGGIGTLTAMAGRVFDYTIPPTILPALGAIVNVDLGAAAQWLQYNSKNLHINGLIPADAKPATITATMTASAPESTFREVDPFVVEIQGNSSIPTTSLLPPSRSHLPTRAVPTPSRSAGTSGAVSAAGKGPSKGTNTIIAVTIVCVVVVLVAIVLAYFYWKSPYRCCRRNARSPRKSEISRPIIRVDEWHDDPRNHLHDLEKGEEEEDRPYGFERPPQVDLNLSPNRRSGFSLNTTINDRESAALNSFHRSTWAVSHLPHESIVLPSDPIHPAFKRKSHIQGLSPFDEDPVLTDTPKRTWRNSMPIQRGLSGLAASRRIMGSPTKKGKGKEKESWRHSFTSFSSQSTSVLNAMSCIFSNPPGLRALPEIPPKSAKRNTASMKRNSKERESLVDNRPMWEKRQSYIRHRAQTRSPFFGASGPSIRSSRLSNSNTTTTGTARTGSSAGTTGFPDSLRQKYNKRTRRPTYSASSSVEPPSLVRKRWTQHLGDQLDHNPNYEIHEHDEDEESSVSFYSQSSSGRTSPVHSRHASRGHNQAGSSVVLRPEDVDLGIQDTVAPLQIRKSLASLHRRDNSERIRVDSYGNVIEYPESESPTIEEMNMAVAVRSPVQESHRRSKMSKASKLSVMDLSAVYLGKEADISMMDRPRPTPRLRGSVVPKLTAGKRDTVRKSTDPEKRRRPLSVISNGSDRVVRVRDGKIRRPVSVVMGEAEDVRSQWAGVKERDAGRRSLKEYNRGSPSPSPAFL